MVHELREIIEWIVHAIEIFAIALMALLIFVATLRASGSMLRGEKAGYASYRNALGQAMLVGLELLVAADIINTVTATPTLTNMATLGALVLVRTFLSWTIAVEVEGDWPWRVRRARGESAQATLAQSAPAREE